MYNYSCKFYFNILLYIVLVLREKIIALRVRSIYYIASFILCLVNLYKFFFGNGHILLGVFLFKLKCTIYLLYYNLHIMMMDKNKVGKVVTVISGDQVMAGSCLSSHRVKIHNL